MVDFFLLLMLAGAGDELQGIKRGIMEMADALIITKADGDNVVAAQHARSLYLSALRLFPQMESGWNVPVNVCSSVTKSGVDQVWEIIKEYEKSTKENQYFYHQRTEQLIRIFYDWIDHTLKEKFYHHPAVKEHIEKLIPDIKSGKITPYQAGGLVLQIYQSSNL
jgi:LAO/AO transport system kinase